MIKEINISLFATAALLLTSCTSEMTEVYPNDSGEIRIALGNGIASRAADGYRDYNPDTDPNTMGVIAFTNGTPTPYIYNNVSFSAPTSGAGAWDITTGTKAKWSTYYGVTALDFFAYMPYLSGATVSKTENTYTLTLNNVPGISDKPYLVATTPVHYTTAYGNVTPVQMQMDHLMTAFEFQFQLGEAMSNLRTFKITNVKMSNVLTSANVSQTYTFNAGSWTKGLETVHPASDHHASAEITSAEGIKIGYNNSPTEAKVFPGMLYMLPYDLSAVAPKIEVTYDVYDQDGYKTRSTTSEIELNTTNFSTLGTVESAHKNTIKIKIVPNKLHILSDADQSTSGYLVVGE